MIFGIKQSLGPNNFLDHERHAGCLNVEFSGGSPARLWRGYSSKSRHGFFLSSKLRSGDAAGGFALAVKLPRDGACQHGAVPGLTEKQLSGNMAK